MVQHVFFTNSYGNLLYAVTFLAFGRSHIIVGLLKMKIILRVNFLRISD